MLGLEGNLKQPDTLGVIEYEVHENEYEFIKN